MQFTYQIENYYPYESRVFVIYTPVDPALPPLGGWVSVASDMTQDQIKAAVVAGAPLDKWQTVQSTSAVALIGFQNEVASSTLTPLVPTLGDAKLAKNAQINLWRAAANQSTFSHLGKVIACDALSRSDIDAVAGSIALTGAFPAGFPNAWKAADNSLLMLPDVAAFKAMYASMTLQGTVNFGRSQTLKAAVAAASTVDQVNAITW